MNQKATGALYFSTFFHRVGFGEEAMMRKKEELYMKRAGSATF